LSKKTKKSNDDQKMDFYDWYIENSGFPLKDFKDERQRKFYHYLALGMKPYPACRKAGYAENYCKSGIYSTLGVDKEGSKKVSQISKNFRDTYPEFCANMLPDIAYMERRIVEKLVDNPDSLDAVKSKLVRDIKRSAGVLQEEARPVQFIPVQVAIQIQQVVDQQQNQPKRITADEIVDIEEG